MKCITFGHILCQRWHYTPDIVGLSCIKRMLNPSLNGAAFGGLLEKLEPEIEMPSYSA
jgi:hypothetical protein